MSEVTVLMTVFNGMPYLEQAVESILCQTLSDFEFIIVDDGSTDGTPAYLRTLKDPRVSVIRQDNGGTAAAANHGLKSVTTRYVARMDADDIALPTRLAKQLAFLQQHPNVGILGSQIVPVGDAGSGNSLSLPCTHEKLFPAMMKGKHGLAHSSVMIDADRLKSIGGYWSLRLIDDWDMMLRMGEISHLANLDEVLLHYRVHSGSLNGTSMMRMHRSIAYAIDRAERRQSNRQPISYESFVQELDSAPLFRRLSERLHIFALAQYRLAVADQCGGKKIAGAVRLGFAALCSPQRTVERIMRMLRSAGPARTNVQNPLAGSTSLDEPDPATTQSFPVPQPVVVETRTQSGSPG